MSYEQRNHDFASAQTDAQMAYIEAERENKKLRELVQYMYRCFVMGHDWGPYCNCETVHVEEQMRELGFKEV